MKVFKLVVAAAVLSGLVGGKAVAATLPFASFSYVGPVRVTYDNTTGVFSGVSIPINFNYISTGVLGTPPVGFGSLAAHMSFSSTALSSVISFPIGGGFSFGTQSLDLTTMSLTLDTPYLGLNNLLAGTASALHMSGTFPGSSASVVSSVSGGDTIAYNSDFLVFPTATDADLSWSLTSLSPILGVSGGNFTSYNATISGIFGYDPSPSAITPEPGVVSMAFGMGIAASAFMWRRRRKS